MEYLYFKKKVAEMRRGSLRPENTLDYGRFTLSQVTVGRGGLIYCRGEKNAEMSLSR